MPIKHRILIEQLLMASAREGMKSILWTESHIPIELRTYENMLKFPQSPTLHYAFSSWIKKTMTKTIHCHWENRFVFG